jgi:hypothetical protein
MKKNIVLSGPIRTIICFLLPVVLAFLFSGCSGRDIVRLHDDGSGRAQVEVELHPFFVAYLDDIVAGFSGAEPGTLPLFDLALLREGIRELPGVVLTEAAITDRRRLNLDFTFSDAGVVFSEREPSPYRFRKLADGTKEAEFTLSGETWPSVRSFVPMSQEQGVETFGPQDPPYGRDEYVDLISFLLEEYASVDALEKMIRSRTVDIEVTVDGTISGVEGFDSFAGSTARASLPLLDLVTLAEPVVLGIRWR